ncbi:hypothetical protein IV102_13895 [bacterium]|nr:hypothetical protein [bacterium]
MSPKVALQAALAEHVIARCAALSESAPMEPGQLEALRSPGTVAPKDSPEGRLWNSIHALPALSEEELCGLPVGSVLVVKDVWENGTTQSVQLLELTSQPEAYVDWSLSSSLNKDSHGCYIEEATTCFRFPRQVGVFLQKDGCEVSSDLPIPGHLNPSYEAGKAVYFLASREMLEAALVLKNEAAGCAKTTSREGEVV